MIKTKKNNAVKIVGIILGVLVVLVGITAAIAYFTLYIPYTKIRAKGEILMATAQTLKADLKKNDIDIIKNKVSTVEAQYADFEKEAKAVYWLTFIPQVQDFKNGVEAGNYVIKAGKLSIEAVEPYADLIGFKKGESSFVNKSTEERLQTAVLTLDKILVKVDDISANLEQAETRIHTIDPNRYPEKVGKTEVRAKIAEIRDQFDGAASFFVRAKPLIKQLPKLLGKDGEKKYLIIMQNENEQRATGGFLTAFASFKIKDGKIELNNSTNIYDLDDSIGSHPVAPDKIQKYHLNVSKFYIRDSNLSPDFVESLKLFNSLYEKSSLKFDYDGVVSVDTKVMVDMLKIFGDTEAGGITFSAKEDPRCDCPQAIYEMLDQVDKPVAYVRENRKGIIGQLMNALFYKAVGFSPSKYWGPLFQEMFKDMDEKHILMQFKDKDAQAAAEQMNYAGRILATPSDFLQITNVNFAGAKSNLFVKKDIESKTIFEGNTVKREVKIVFTNPYEHSDCNLERGQLCLNATLRNWIRFYVPEGSKLTSFKGSQKETLTYDELGKTVYEGFMTVAPKGRAEVTITYTLPQSITPKNYELYLQKQASEDKATIRVGVDNKLKFEGPFKVDKKITL